MTKPSLHSDEDTGVLLVVCQPFLSFVFIMKHAEMVTSVCLCDEILESAANEIRRNDRRSFDVVVHEFLQNHPRLSRLEVKESLRETLGVKKDTVGIMLMAEAEKFKHVLFVRQESLADDTLDVSGLGFFYDMDFRWRILLLIHKFPESGMLAASSVGSPAIECTSAADEKFTLADWATPSPGWSDHQTQLQTRKRSSQSQCFQAHIDARAYERGYKRLQVAD